MPGAALWSGVVGAGSVASRCLECSAEQILRNSRIRILLVHVLGETAIPESDTGASVSEQTCESTWVRETLQHMHHIGSKEQLGWRSTQVKANLRGHRGVRAPFTRTWRIPDGREIVEKEQLGRRKEFSTAKKKHP